MKEEINSINKNNTWELTSLLKDHRANGIKWVFKTKRNANGNIKKHKVKIIVKDRNNNKELIMKKSLLLLQDWKPLNFLLH